MSLTTGEMSAADIAAVVGNRNNGDGFGFGGDNGWWIILLFLCLFGNGGWGNNGMNGGNGGGFVPYYLANNTDNGVQAGFNNAAIAGQLNGIQTGVQALGTQLCNSTAGIQQTINAGLATAEVADNARQMANMNQIFMLSSQLADCCCENRLATANLSALVQSENCADRAVLSDGIRDIIASQTAGTQRIIDQLCQDKIDAKNEKIADLERQLTMANLAASQTAQTAQLLADNNRQTVALEQYLNPAPVPAYIVQNPNCCQQNGCGCGY